MVDPLDVKFAALTAEFEKLIEAAGDQKAKKGVVNTTKMFKAIKASGSVVADLLTSFQNAGTATDVFKSVVSDYSTYLSDTFWGEILTAIDFETITALFVDTLGPALEGAAEALAGVIETDTVQGAMIGFFNVLEAGLLGLEALFTGDTSKLEELAAEWQAEGFSWWNTQAQEVTALGNFERMFPDIDLDALGAQATAGGVYSGQFDLDIDALNKMLGVDTQETQEQILEEMVGQNARIGRMISLLEDQSR